MHSERTIGLNIQQLNYLSYIEKTGSINRAAELLFVSPSTISVSLKELESEVGQQLFTRSNSGMTATNEGYEFIKQARQVLTQLDVMREIFVDNASERQWFSVSSQHYDFASEAFSKFISEDPSDRFVYRFFEVDTYSVIKNVAQNVSEIGFVYLSEFNRRMLTRLFEQENLQYNIMWDFQPHVFVRKGHPLTKMESVKYKDLMEFPAITFEQTENQHEYLTEHPLEIQANNRKVVVSDRMSAINIIKGSDAYLTGSGIMTNQITEPHIASIPLESSESHHICWIAPKYHELSDNAKNYLSLAEVALVNRVETLKTVHSSDHYSI